MSTWNGSPQRELTTNPLSGKLGADHGGAVFRPLPVRLRPGLPGPAARPDRAVATPPGSVPVFPGRHLRAHPRRRHAGQPAAGGHLPGPDQPARGHRALLCGSDRDKWDVLTDHPGRAMINYSPPPREVLHMWRVRDGQASEQQRQQVQHPRRCVAKCFRWASGATSCDRLGTRGEGGRSHTAARTRTGPAAGRRRPGSPASQRR